MSDPTAALATIHARNQRIRLERIEDVRWLADTGECLTGAAHRLGLKPTTLEAWARRHVPDAYLKLRAREPGDPNQRPGMRAMQGKQRWGA